MFAYLEGSSLILNVALGKLTVLEPLNPTETYSKATTGLKIYAFKLVKS